MKSRHARRKKGIRQHRRGPTTSTAESANQASKESRYQVGWRSDDLTPPRVLQLQRQAGNRAVVRLIKHSNQPTVQLKPLIPGKTFLSQVGDQFWSEEIARSLDQYNAIADDNQKFSQRLKLLNKIDRALYTQFDKTRVTELSQVSISEPMMALLKETEKEHESIIDATKSDVNMLPIDTTGLNAAEQQALLTLWRSIVEGTGQIQLAGDKRFNKRTMARLAKILQTPTGRNMLRFLNTPKGDAPGPSDKVIIGEKLPKELKKIKHLKEEDQPVSYALELSANRDVKNLRGPFDKAGDENAADFLDLASINDLRDAYLAGKKGVFFNNKKYLFGTGSGSFVKVVEGKSGLKHSDTAGEGGSEAITPGFITLAHELGHALNIRAGAATRDLAELMVPVSGLPSQQKTEDLWTNSEEFFNIKGIENAIRQESGISKRGSHKPKTAIFKMQRVEGLSVRLNQLTAIDQSIRTMEPYEDVAKLLDEHKGELEDDVILGKLDYSITQLEKMLSNQFIAEFKKRDLLEYMKLLDDKVAGRGKPLDDTQNAEYQAIQGELKDNMDTLVALGTNDWQTMKDRIRTLRFAV